MQRNRVLLTIAILLGIFHWLLDSIIEFEKNSGISFLSYLIDPAELPVRISILIAFIILGAIAGHMITLQQQANNTLQTEHLALIKSKEQMRSEKEKAQKYLEVALVIFIVLDKEGHVTLINSKGCEILGYPEEEILGKNWFTTFLPENERDAVYKVFLQIMDGKLISLESYENSIRSRDGKEHIIAWHNAILQDDGGKIIGSLSSGEDITKQRQNEIEIRKLNQELEQKVEERTRELTVSNRELEAFSYSVSHDLRAPLRGIDGLSLAILEDYADKVDPTGKDILQRIRAACQRMGKLIDDLLSLSRITRTPMIIEEVDLSSISDSICSELMQRDPARLVTFHIQRHIKALGDKNLLQILLFNLFDNAWKFTMRKLSALIEFGVIEEEKTTYFVRDNGAGFDITYRDKLFKPFQRLHSMEDFEGTGIGLATVQRIVNRHGGAIWAESAIDMGATFFFTLNQIKNS